jgi:hypothetical protein
VEANSTGGQGSRRAVAPSDDDDDDDLSVLWQEHARIPVRILLEARKFV